MDSYFDMLELPRQFALNLKTLETVYFEAQRSYHPDRLVGKSDAERTASVLRSQVLNDAYDTLKNPLRRAEHLLELQGIVALDDDTPVPPALLMEMMELRESIADAGQDGAALARALEDVKARMAHTLSQMEVLFEATDYPRAAEETMRFHYLGKALEEAHMLVYRLKAAQAHG